MAKDPARGSLSGELELQASWFAGEFGRQFKGTEGESVHIIQFGVWNRCAGPDFVEAAVSINGAEPVRGAIEIDPDVRDWERHGHGHNPAYENVVLHVFRTNACEKIFSRTHGHRRVPQVHLPCSNPTRNGFVPQAHPGRCAATLAGMQNSQLLQTLSEAARFRFQRKATALARTSEVHGENETLFQAVATTMGYPNNPLPFRLLAQRLPLRKLSENPAAVEPLLFGLSGFLPSPDISKLPATARAHVKALWEGWWGFRASHQPLAIPAPVWRMSGHRPANHPARRVGALSAIVRHWRTFKRLVQEANWKRLRVFLGALEHPFWSVHYSFSSAPSARPLALVGAERINELLVNCLFPYTGDWEALSNLKVSNQNRRSRVAATRMLANLPEPKSLLNRAVHQQGLLELYEAYCCKDSSDCVRCPFPEQSQRFGP